MAPITENFIFLRSRMPVRAEGSDITPATKHIQCRAGLDPASRSALDTAFTDVTNREDKNN